MQPESITISASVDGAAAEPTVRDAADARARRPRSVRPVPADVVAQVRRLLTDAYQRTGLAAWLVPNESGRPRIIHGWITLVTETAFDNGLVEVTQDRKAATVWLPGPAPAPPDQWLRLAHATAPFAGAFAALHRALERAAPAQPHHRLLYAGVEPAVRGKRRGSRLLCQHLATLDQRQMPAYAGATDPNNVRWLARNGFNAHGPPIVLPAHGLGSAGGGRRPPRLGLTIQPMWRPPAQPGRGRPT